MLTQLPEVNVDSLKSTFASLSIEKILPSLLALVAGLIIARLLCKLFDKVLNRSKVEKSLHGFLRSLFHIILYVLVGLIVAGTLGLNVSSLVAILGVVSLAISLAVQGTLANIAGGIQILTAHPFHVGDYVEIAGTDGTVAEIGMIYTRLTTVDNKGIYLPNSDVASSKIINYTAEGKRRVDLSFSASYDCTTQDVRAALLKAAQVDGVLSDPAPEAYVKEYDESSISYILRVWSSTADYWDVYFRVTENVRNEFENAGLSMTYPHLNVHLDNK